MQEINELKREELKIIQTLANQIWPHAFQEILSPEQIEYMLNRMYDLAVLENQFDKGHRFFVFKNEQKAVGFMAVEIQKEENKVKIHKIYLLAETQGKGFGKMLIEKAIEITRVSKLKLLYLNVNRFNSAVQFYKHLGFEILKEENIDIGNGFWMEDYVMNYWV
jgi:ribosomal protein S18 acetylase RimI-like enzyme